MSTHNRRSAAVAEVWRRGYAPFFEHMDAAWAGAEEHVTLAEQSCPSIIDRNGTAVGMSPTTGLLGVFDGESEEPPLSTTEARLTADTYAD